MTTATVDYKTILNQLTMSNNGITTLKLFISAYDFLVTDKGQAIRFKFKGCRKADYCKIFYNYSKDTYDMHIHKINKDPEKIESEKDFYLKMKTFKDIYFDDLKPLFEEYTGLYLRLY